MHVRIVESIVTDTNDVVRFIPVVLRGEPDIDHVDDVVIAEVQMMPVMSRLVKMTERNAASGPVIAHWHVEDRW